MAHQLSRPALAMRGRRGLWSLCLRYSSIARVLSSGIEELSAGDPRCPHPNPPPAKPGEGMHCSTPRSTLGSTPLPPPVVGEGWDGGPRCLPSSPSRTSICLLAALVPMLVFPPIAHGQVSDGVPPPKHKWTKFVTVAGQPEPIPAEWVATPEGQFAHSIVIPNPVPKDSGYHWWWSAKKYFLHLCEKEAGEFVFKTVENVEGFLFMRPPKQPTDFDLKDRYKLEAPAFEARYQLREESVVGRAAQFVSPPFRQFQFYEEPAAHQAGSARAYVVASEYEDKPPYFRSVKINEAVTSRYAVTWRGLRRSHDRESGIDGVEVIVFDVTAGTVLGVMRAFSSSGRTPQTPDGIWWLNAAICPAFYKTYRRPDMQQMYGFVSKVLQPRAPTGVKQ